MFSSQKPTIFVRRRRTKRRISNGPHWIPETAVFVVCWTWRRFLRKIRCGLLFNSFFLNNLSGKMRKRPIVQKLEETNSSEVEAAAEVCRSACLSLWDSFLAMDHRLTTHLAVCANKESSFGNFRPLMKILEISCHGVPWLIGTILLFLFSHKPEDIEVTVNLFFALIFDLIIVGLLKMTFRRGRPSHNVMDIFVAPSVDKFSFPSGHATRAAMMTLFLCQHMFTNRVYMAILCIWAASVCMSRILLGRHHIFDVVCGIFIGVIAYSAYLNLWISKAACLSYLDTYFGHIHV